MTDEALLVTAEEHARVVTALDTWQKTACAWQMTASKTQAALDKLKADRSFETIRTAGSLCGSRGF